MMSGLFGELTLCVRPMSFQQGVDSMRDVRIGRVVELLICRLLDRLHLQSFS
jgi:hypothetical protein